MIRIAISYSDFSSAKSGGARESLLTLLEGLSASREITADVFQTPPTDDPPETAFDYRQYAKRLHEIPELTWTNQVFQRLQWNNFLRKRLTTDYDVLLTQNKLAPVSVQLAAQFQIPSLFFVRSMALTGYEKYNPSISDLSNVIQTDLGGRIQYPFLRKNFNDYRSAARTATATVANSEFTANKLDELFGVEASVIYPPIEQERYRVSTNQKKYITMVNPRTLYKGPDIFLDVADQLIDELFLLVGPISSAQIRERVERTDNVTYWDWCEDMRDVYSQSKLVMVPSRWEEPFGRVAAEAMVSGVPCVVSDRGGLPEVVGDTGEIVSEVESVDHWVAAVRRALETHEPERQKDRAEKFSAERQTEKLADLIDQVT